MTPDWDTLPTMDQLRALVFRPVFLCLALLSVMVACDMPPAAQLPGYVWDHLPWMLDWAARIIAGASVVLAFCVKVGGPLAAKTDTHLDDDAVGFATKLVGWLGKAMMGIAWIAAHLALNVPHAKMPARADTESDLIDPFEQ